MAKTREKALTTNAQVLQMIQDSGVLNPKMPLEELMNLTLQVASLDPTPFGEEVTDRIDWWIHRDFIYVSAE